MLLLPILAAAATLTCVPDSGLHCAAGSCAPTTERPELRIDPERGEYARCVGTACSFLDAAFSRSAADGTVWIVTGEDFLTHLWPDGAFTETRIGARDEASVSFGTCVRRR